jgi:hypothetical protein
MQLKTKLAVASVSILTLGGGGLGAALLAPTASAASRAQVSPAPPAPAAPAPPASTAEPAGEPATETPEPAETGAPEKDVDTHDDGGQADHQCPKDCGPNEKP